MMAGKKRLSAIRAPRSLTTSKAGELNTDEQSINPEPYFDRATWMRGVKLWQTGSVIKQEIPDPEHEEVWTVLSLVKGSARTPYNSNCAMVLTETGPHIYAECSCPVGLYCKHSVAAILEAGFARPTWPTQIIVNPQGGVSEHDNAVPMVAPHFVGDASNGGEDKTRNGFSHSALDVMLSTIIDDGAAPRHAPKATPKRSARLSYHLTLDQVMGVQLVQLAAAKTTIKRDGSDGVTKLYKQDWPRSSNGYHHDRSFYPAHYDEEDIEWSMLFSGWQRGHDGGVLLIGKRARSVLIELIKSGKVYWQDSFGAKLTTDKPLLRLAEQPQPFRLVWLATNPAQQKLALCLEHAHDRAEGLPTPRFLPLDPPLVVDPITGLVAAPLGLEGIEPLARLLALQETHRDDWALLLDKLREADIRGVEQLPPLPASLPVTTFTAQPSPTLTLKGSKPKRSRYSWERHQPLPYGEVSFTYSDEKSGQSKTVRADVAKPLLQWSAGNQVFEVKRDGAAEQRHLQTLLDFGLVAVNFEGQQQRFQLVPDADIALEAEMMDGRLNEETFPNAVISWAEFYFDQDLQNALRVKGWQVVLDKSYPQPMRDLSTASASANISARADEPGWFDYAVKLDVDGKKIDFGQFLPTLFAEVTPGFFLNEDDREVLAALPRIMMLPSGELVAVDWPAILPLLKPLLAWIAGNSDVSKQGLTRSDLAALTALYDPNLPCPLSLPAGQQNLRELIRDKSQTTELRSHVKGIQAELRPYQLAGVDWLNRLVDHGFGGILADDMGLGKTLQCISFLIARRQSGETRPALIVAPKSVLPNWLAEFEKFAPNLKVVSHHGTGRVMKSDDLAQRLAGASALITSYPVLSKDHEMLSQLNFCHMILDEAQAVKNPKAKVTIAAAAIKADTNIALSGTPVQNNLGELWSLVNLTNPGLLRDVKSFNAAYRSPIEKKGEAAPQRFLNAKLRPFILRRDKSTIATELPEKIVTDVVVEMDDKQKAIYEAIRVSMDKKVREAMASRGLARSRIELLEALLRLRQVCCDPALLLDSGALPATALKGASSAKLSRLEELLDEMICGGRRILLFSQFTGMLDRIEALLDARGWDHLRLDGKSQNRGELVKTFQSGDMPVFLVSLQAGGVGLNLTAADTVVHYDPWWNPAVEDQATDRAYRIGQEKAVFVYRLLAKGSVEEAINLMQSKKRALASALFDNNSDKPLELSEEDVALLLRPVG